MAQSAPQVDLLMILVLFFRDDFLSGFRAVLGMFWETFWCQNDDQKAKGGFVEMLVLRKQY